MGENFTQKLRQSAIELGEFNINDLAHCIPVYTYKDKHRIIKLIQALKRNGEIVSIRRGFYCYQGKKRPLTKKARMWRAIRIKEYFTRRDVVKLSGAPDAYVRWYLSFLKRDGFIEHISGRGYRNGLYRLTNSTDAPLDHPIINSNSKF